MAKRLSDDEIMDMTYNKLFGDLDDIRSGAMFDDAGEGRSIQTNPADNAGTPGIEGVSVEIKPLMNGAAESAKPDDLNNNIEEEEEGDKLRGISKLSPLMAQLHGER